MRTSPGRGLRDLNIRFGQMKVPFDRQRVVSSSSLQMVDRSIVVGELNLDRDVGIQLLSTNFLGLGDRIGYQLGIFGGDGRNRLSSTYGLLYVARVQFTPFGRFDDYVESDLTRLPRPRLAIGLGVAHNQNTRRDRSTLGNTFEQSFDYTHVEADLIFKLSGFSLQAEAIYRGADTSSHMRTGMTSREFSRSAFGYFVQAGYLFTPHFEVSARWGDLYPVQVDAGPRDPSQRISRELGAGLSYYFQEHAFKIQSDYFYLFGEDIAAGRHQVRVQAQLYF